MKYHQMILAGCLAMSAFIFSSFVYATETIVVPTNPSPHSGATEPETCTGTARRVIVRDHRGGRTHTSIYYRTSDIDINFLLAKRDSNAQRSCSDYARIIHRIVPVRLSPACNMGAKNTVIIDNRYNLDPLGVGDCVVQQRVTGLALGTWRIEIISPAWQTQCEIELTSTTGKIISNFRNNYQGCMTGIRFSGE